MIRPVGLLGVAKATVREARECALKYPAAALAYYAFVSFVPLLLLVFSVVGHQFAGTVAAAAPPFVTPDARRLIHEALTTATGQTGALLLAGGVLAWSAGNVAVDFLTVVDRVEGTTAESLARRLRDAGVVLGGISAAIVVVLLTNVLFDGSAAGPVGVLRELLALCLALTATFVPLYYAPSAVVASPTAALPGAATAAVGWTGIHTVVQFYAGHAAAYAVYGVLSGIIIILTGLYLAAVTLMLGVVVNATLAADARSPAAVDA